MPQRETVVVSEPVPVIAARPAELRAPAHGFHFSGLRMEPHIPTGHIQLFARLVAGDVLAEVAARTVEPAIKTVCEAVDAMLRIGEFEAREPDVALVRSAVAVRVLCEDLWGGADKCAVFPRKDAGRVGEAVEEDLRFVVRPVFVLIGENDNFAARLSIVIDAAGIVAHLDDPQPPIGPDRHVDRIGNQRLGRNHAQLHLLGNRERLQGFIKGERPIAGGVRQELVNAAHHDLFRSSRPAAWLEVVDHRSIDFVAAF